MTDPATTLDRLAVRAEQLFSLPTVAMQILDLMQNPQVDPRTLKECIENDPALAGKVLRVVNSSLFGLSRQVSDLQQALGLLGIKPLKLLVLGFSLPTGLFLDLEAKTLSWYWRRTLTKAIACRELAEQLWPMPGDEAFLVGLFQDLGVLLLLQELGRPYARLIEVALARRLDLGSLETAALRFRHSALSAKLLGRWKLPQALCEAVGAEPEGGQKGTVPFSSNENWDSPPLVAPPTLAKILHLAELVARLLVDGQPDALAQLTEDGREYHRRFETQLGPLVAQLGVKVEQLADILSLELPGGLEYRDVLAEAHGRLAGVAAAAAEDALRAGQLSAADLERDELLDEIEELAAAVAAVCRTAGDQAPQRCVGRGAHADLPPAAPTTCTKAGLAVETAHLLDPLAQAVAASRRCRQPLSLLLVEVAPDRELLPTVEAWCRGVDHPLAICRPYGALGFALILPGCDRRRGVELGRQLVHNVLQATASGEAEASGPAPVGIGIASVALPPKNFPAADLLHAAARCLFGSHASGDGVVKSIEIY